MTTTADSAKIAFAVAERLLDPESVAAAVPGPGTASLARGLAGTALLHARLSATDPVFAAAADHHWAKAAAYAGPTGYEGPGVYHNPGGLAASLIIGTAYLPAPESRHQAVERAARWMSAQAVDLAGQHQAHQAAGEIGTPRHVYDVITGLTGIGRVLLASVRTGHDAEPGLLAALTSLTTMIHTRHGPLPGWWSSNTPTEAPCAATGIAHGIAGPLMLLSQARVAGHEVDGQAEAIREAAAWLLRWQISDTRDWPPYVTETELTTGIAAPVSGRRDAWCYGTPGIHRALTAAARAIGDPALGEAADNARSALIARLAACWDVAGPALCHGYAGVLQATRDDQAAAAVIALFNNSDRFGFPRAAKPSETSEDPGFLTGAAGAALALADHGAIPAAPGADPWEVLLLLA
ncbi:lanthionine synthetase C family protein [Rhizohabitans arisaemae]|uniref:lanthionine synthetase C family protein n=1 Tax=Rhizohabitans arisaemae TaxID=2720610 RepID=UPI0024B1CC88|nr:lanthionine synthetase C family protein [Rhizohabitans arisaemae]